MRITWSVNNFSLYVVQLAPAIFQLKLHINTNLQFSFLVSEDEYIMKSSKKVGGGAFFCGGGGGGGGGGG